MSFINEKERIFDIILTQHGRKKLSQGEFQVKWYAFGDDDADYNPPVHIYTSGTSAAYTPLVDSPRLWLRGDVGLVMTGSGVGIIDDQSGNNFSFIQNTVNNQPLTESVNGRTALTFSGSKTMSCIVAQSLIITGSGNNPNARYEINAVVVIRSTASLFNEFVGPSVFAANATNRGIRLGYSGSIMLTSHTSTTGVRFATASFVPLQTTIRLRGYFDGTTINSLNGSGSLFSSGTVNSASFSAAAATLGSTSFSGALCELVVHEHTLSNPQRQQLDNWFTQRWGAIITPM